MSLANIPVTNVALCALFIAVFVVLFLPVSRWSKKLLDWEITGPVASILALLGVGGVIIRATQLAGIIYILLVAFCLWAFFFGFLVDRRYIYTLALIFLSACPFLLIAKMDQIAEFSAVLCYLCLVLGVLKDLVYEKIID